MPQALHSLKETPSQTAGPYVHIGLAPGAAGFEMFETDLGGDIAGPEASGERIRVEGKVIDGSGSAVKDVMLEVWQANAQGIYAHIEDPRHGEVEDGFRGWGRVISDFISGLWSFETVKPGPCLGRSGQLVAPHLNFWIVARGIHVGLNTRMYFADEAHANTEDPVLNLIEQAVRRQTLIAARSEVDGMPVYRFDIVLQGPNETVFFDV